MEIKCSECGKALGANAIEGLCPECLMKVGLGTQTETGGPQASAGLVAPKPEEIAAHFPQLDILELIGRGGMGAVYKARQKQLGRIVALKILPPGVGDQAAFAERFAREARALATLNHPGIVTLYEFGQTNGLFFFLMEFVDGVNLRQLLHGGRIAPREALAIVPQICDALQYAHDQGIVHRDIKPENILLDRKGRVKVADFGLARLMGLENQAAEPRSGEAASASLSLTEAGKVMGTPQYMAPEQMEHPTEVDHRADIYSLGVVLYQMLTGELPGKPLEAPSRKVHLDVRLDEVVLRALERAPERRYQQASAMKTQVETIATLPRQAMPSSAKIGKIAALVMVLLVLGLAVVNWKQSPAGIHERQPQVLQDPGANPEGSQQIVPHLSEDSPYPGKPTFGPVIERTIEAVATGTNCFLDLDSGKLFTPPAEITRDFGPEDSGGSWGSRFSGSKANEMQPWPASSGADVKAGAGHTSGAGEDKGLTMFGGLSLGPLDWDEATPEGIVETIRAAEEQIPKATHKPMPFSFMRVEEGLPKGFAFKTREGARGILQILGFTENQRGVMIRYKLVQNWTTKVAVSSSAAVSSQTAASFGPVTERVLHDAYEKLGYEALDLLKGTFLSFPRQASADGDWLPPWLETNRVDLIAGRESERWYLMCVKTKLSDFATESWAGATPADAAAALQPGTSLQQLDDDTVDDATTKAGVVIYRLPPPTQLPQTFALQTREGVQGLLQLTGFTEEPRGLTIRYKLVQKSESAMQSVSSAPGEPADVLRKILTDFPYGIWNKPLAHHARNRRSDGWFALLNFPPVEDSWVSPAGHATGRDDLNLPADAPGEKVAQKAHTGDLYVPDLDHLVPLRGTMLAPLESGKSPDGFPPQDQSTLKKVLNYKTRPEIVQAITTYDAAHPEDKWVRLEEGGRYGALRPDGELLLITAFGTGDEKSVQLIPIGRVGDGLPETPDPKRTSRANAAKKVVKTEPTPETASAVKSGKPLPATNGISVSLSQTVLVEAATNQAQRMMNSSDVNSPGAAPILARDVSLNFTNPLTADGALPNKAQPPFDFDLHNQALFAVTTMLIGQTEFVVGVMDGRPAGTRVNVQDSLGRGLMSETWDRGTERFQKFITLPVDYNQKHYACPVLLEFGRLKGEKYWGTYHFCAYLSGVVSLAGGEYKFELANRDPRIVFPNRSDEENPAEVLGIDLNRDGKLDPSPDGGETFTRDEVFAVGGKHYRLARADALDMKVTFEEVMQPDYVKAQALLRQSYGVGAALEETIQKKDDLGLAQKLALQMMEHLRAYNDLVRGTLVELPLTNVDVLATLMSALKAGKWDQAESTTDSGMELTDFSKRLEDLAAVQRAQAFGPVLERVLPLKRKAGAAYCLDFDTGALLAPPGRLTVVDMMGWDQWCAQSGVDALAEERKSVPVIWGQRCAFAKVETARWSTIRPARVVKELIGNNNTVGQAELPNRGAIPATFLFRTREGGRGVLQITGFAESPPGIKIRYKLVEAARSAGTTNAASTK